MRHPTREMYVQEFPIAVLWTLAEAHKQKKKLRRIAHNPARVPIKPQNSKALILQPSEKSYRIENKLFDLS